MVRINLQPWRQHHRIKKLVQYSAALVPAILIPVIGVVLYSMFIISPALKVQQAKQDLLQQELLKVARANNRLKLQVKQQQNLLAQVNAIQRNSHNQEKIYLSLNEVVTKLPKSTLLNEIALTKTSLVISGKSASNQRLIDFFSQLSKGKYFYQPKLVKLETGTGSFSINLRRK